MPMALNTVSNAVVQELAAIAYLTPVYLEKLDSSSCKRGPMERVDNTTGEIMCLVEVPAAYKTVQKKVMAEPPSTRTVNIPAEYDIVRKRVMVTPPRQRIVQIPAAYKTVKVRKMVSPPQEHKIAIPAEFQTITRTEMASDGHMEWRKILCETKHICL